MTLAITYYEAPEMLKQHLSHWSVYPEGVHIVVVDDGSPTKPAEKVLAGLKLKNVSLYRIEEDIFNNVGGARNLAFTVAAEGWVFNTDIDHVVPAGCMQALLNMEFKLNSKYYYSPARYRYQMDGEELDSIERHGDTFIMAKKLFWEVGGYDEDYVEYYHNGASFLFRREMKRVSSSVELNNVWSLYYGPNIIKDASPIKVEGQKKLTKHIEHYNPQNPLRFGWEQLI